MHEALLLADRGAQQQALMKNDEGIKETVQAFTWLIPIQAPAWNLTTRVGSLYVQDCS